jgi:hypothetical protein
MLDEVTKRLSTKITNLFGNVWRVIDGVMPSGAYETSHGDSWITALVYTCFIEWLMIKDLKFREFVRSPLGEQLLLSVYGDDNVFGFPSEFLPWFTKKNFSFFFKEFGNFELRDFEIHDCFCSERDERGEIKKKRVVFLQKYCVKLPEKFEGFDLPPVVQYRPASTSIMKFAKGSGDVRSDMDYFLSSITGPYDNPFNQVAYDFYGMMYNHFYPEGDWKSQIRKIIANASGYVNRQFRKSHMSIADIEAGFPSPTKLINISKYDKEHHENHFRDIWTDPIEWYY